MSFVFTINTKSYVPVTIQKVQKLRDETAGTKNVIHLNNAGSGLMPDMVTQVRLDHIKLESQIGGYEASAEVRNGNKKMNTNNSQQQYDLKIGNLLIQRYWAQHRLLNIAYTLAKIKYGNK